MQDSCCLVYRQRQAWFIDYVDATGRRMRQTIGAGDENERLAKKVLAQREAEAQLGIHHLPAAQTLRFAEFAVEWLQRAQARRLAPKTSDSYRGFTHVLADAVDHRKLTENIAAKVKAPVRHDRQEEMQILTPEAFGRLLDVAEAPWRAVYLVAVRTGLRRGELLTLKWADLNLSQRFVDVKQSLGRIRDGDRYVVRETPLKTRKSRRRVGLSADVVGRAFKRHLTLAKLPEVPFHSLRHTFTSFEIAAGVHPKTLQAELGHASITVTMDRYGHLMPTALDEATALRESFIQGNMKATAVAGERQETLEPAR